MNMDTGGPGALAHGRSDAPLRPLLQTGDLSIEIDRRVKFAVASYCGKEQYVAGDLTREVASRAKTKAIEFTGKGDYQFGDVTRELNKRRAEWVDGYLGKEYEVCLSDAPRHASAAAAVAAAAAAAPAPHRSFAADGDSLGT